MTRELSGAAIIHKVKLSQLPRDVQFPPELSVKVSYSIEAQELRFAGFMSKTDFDKLVRVSADLSYQRALERLFQDSTFAPQAARQAPTRNRWLLVAASAAMAIVLTVPVVVVLNRGVSPGDIIPVVNQSDAAEAIVPVSKTATNDASSLRAQESSAPRDQQSAPRESAP